MHRHWHVLYCLAGLLSAAALPADAAEPPLADDPLIQQIRENSEVIEREGQARERAQPLWAALTPEQKAETIDFVRKHDGLAATLPNLVAMLKSGQDADARTLLTQTYSIDTAQGDTILALIRYANGIK